MNIKINLTDSPKEKPNPKELGFGKHFTDHMFVMDFYDGKWQDARIVEFGDMQISPANMTLHYGQSVFEGLKAFKNENDDIVLFRPKKNFARLNSSADRLCIPPIDEEFALEALIELLKVEKDWIPTEENTSLYIRPFIFADENALGVHPANRYKFMILLSPVGSYYGTLGTTKILIEDKYSRAAPGGTGNIKASANYAISMKAQEKAEEKGYAQVLWLDPVEKKYIEEVGSMNLLLKIDGTVYTAPLDGTILPGITRDSVLTIIRKKGIPVEEKKVSIDELIEAGKNGTLEEAFGAGTAAKISPIGEFLYKDTKIIVNDNKIGDLSQELFDILTDIQTGKIEDEYGFNMIVK